ncbi:hypothetical protein DVA86_33680 [Streptomyces armeniacus]|uniref:C2H2-type domain-containing protein n=1 Tax=Streptomyces armeniacus TaxID=83291 RepID=A0A345XYQ7_9ACTN|nr:hypothetical protein DVA86_33680 [Streptomyces armeniacus]
MKDSSGTGGGTAGGTGGGAGTVHEAYSFACMKCGYGWEQTYDIEHHVPPDGKPFVTYYTEGHRVPSPLTNPTCVNCDGHVLRIMRSGRVANAEQALSKR